MKPISRTAFYCCGVRMQDAELPKPVCGDVYAKVFMSQDGLQILDTFKDERGPNTSNVARHRIIDDFLRQELLANPTLRVIIIGAGFDTRAFRLKGGDWIELDEPQVIAYKEERLPASGAQNELHRVPIDFSTDLLEEKLSAFADRGPVVVVIEGVFMYLEPQAIDELLRTLRRLFPHHKLICDLMTRVFFQKYGRTIHEKITGMGASFNGPPKAARTSASSAVAVTGPSTMASRKAAASAAARSRSSLTSSQYAGASCGRLGSGPPCSHVPRCPRGSA